MTAPRFDTRLFELMVNRVRDYAIFLLDPAGHVMSWNPGAERIKQYTAEDIIGRHFSTFYTAEDKARNWPQIELERATMEGRFEDEGWRVRKDGSRFWANVVITALRDDSGKLLAFSKITRDLTERRQQEERVRDSEERFRLLVEGVQDYAIFLLTPEGLVNSWNLGAERISGYAASDIIGRHFSHFYAAEDIEQGKPWAELAIARENGRAEDEGWRVRKDGSRYWAKVAVTALYDRDGRLRGFAKVQQDMTQQRQSAALESAARRLNDFIAVLAHELRNPLAPIRNAARLLEEVQPGDPDFEVLRQAIDRQSAQLSRIVDDLLDIGRITRGIIEIHKSRVEVKDIVSRAVEAAQPGLNSAGHRLELDLPAVPVYVEADPLRLTQALTNILNNAARYTPSGGTITVKVWTEKAGKSAEVAISVRDNGRGIEPDFLAAIFEMFVQGRDPLGRAGMGLGVGLALARSIVELHHGTIEAKSAGAGKGAEFIIRLPRGSAAQAPAEAAHAGQKPSLSATHNRRILVVDDNVDAAEMLAAILRQLGNEVEVVHEGALALETADSFRPEVILLDIGMPGMNGFEVARRLRERRRNPEPLIVAVTGWGKAEDETRTREAGFDMHLVKPVEEEELRRVLEKRQIH